MKAREGIHAQLEMYFQELFPSKYADGEDWVLSRIPFIIARLFETGFENADFPKWYLSIEGDLLDDVDDSPFTHELVTKLNSAYDYLKFDIAKSGDRLTLRSVITVPADDLQKKEVVFACFMSNAVAQALVPRLEKFFENQSFG